MDNCLIELTPFLWSSEILNVWCEIQNTDYQASKSAKAKGALPTCRLNQIQKLCKLTLAANSSLKSREVMGTLTSQAKGIQEFVVDGFNDLPNASQPATQGFGPMDAACCVDAEA